MLLYKNVDICDLESIMSKGILSIEECGNDNWADGKRANNDTSVIYIFKPLGEVNSFPKYGVALLEVDCDAIKSKMLDGDCNRGKYEEYIIDHVQPSKIKRIIIPEIFREYISIPSGIDIHWCALKADYYGDHGMQKADDVVLKQFAKTAPLMDSTWYNFFRGKMENKEIFDLYNVQYKF